ncbi:hypothetical protein BDA99DRAFT_560847 [Phascolomyces articulosus]|uniref:RING-type domain-containing protein n=1 Tax=Phascolomyces articulosus TaxID=60185 RepID=A0AAD5PCK8_9FUNG|nr:hypothetical protein BDA99DRAFT_560847 [Phascolomyces articulosus]
MSHGIITAARYYCHRCRSNTSVFRAPIPICGACQSPFVEEILHNSNESERPRSENEDTEQLSERLNNTLTFQQYRQGNVDNRSITSSSSTNEPVTDDGDENYEDIEEDEGDEEEDEEDEEDSDFEFQPWRSYYDENYSEDEEDAFLHPWRRYYRRAAQDLHHHHQSRQAPTPAVDEYDIDQYYDEINDYHSRLADENHHRSHHNHFQSGGLPMIEQLLSMLYDGNAPDIDDPDHPLSSILHDMLHNDDSNSVRVAASPEQVEKLEKRQLRDGDTEVETECIICQEAFGVDTELMKMPCKHEYHSKCIRHWLSVSTTCPMCRSSLPANEQPPPALSSDREERSDGYTSSNGRTFTFQSPAGSTTVGIWVADPSTLPHEFHNLARSYLDNEDDNDDDDNDDDEDNDTLSYDEDSEDIDDDFEDYDDYDEYGDEEEEDEEDEDDLMWNFSHSMLHMCPHGVPRVSATTFRQGTSTTGTTRTEQQQNSRRLNPMDELD